MCCPSLTYTRGLVLQSDSDLTSLQTLYHMHDLDIMTDDDTHPRGPKCVSNVYVSEWTVETWETLYVGYVRVLTFHLKVCGSSWADKHHSLCGELVLC